MKKIDEKNDNKSTAKTAILNTVANVIALIIGAIMIPLITRVMSSEDIGIASTFISNRNILVILVTLASYEYVHKAMLEFHSEKVDYIYSISMFCVLMVAVSFVICMPFKETLKHILSLDEFLYYWLFVSMLAYSLYMLGRNYCIFHNKSLIVFMIVLCSGPIAQISSILLSFFMPQNKYIGRVLGLDAMYFVVAIVLLIWLLTSGKHHYRNEHIRNTLSFTVPVIPHLLAQLVLTQCDLIMISYFEGSDKSGIYSMGHTVGFLAFTVMVQIMAIWSPWVYRKLEEKNFKSVYNNANYIVLIGAYLTIGLMTVEPELVKIFLTNEYTSCMYIIPPLALSMFAQFIYIFLYDLEYYYKKPYWITCTSAFAAVLNIVLNLIFIPKYGYLAAGYTTLVSYFLLMVLNLALVRRLGCKFIYKIPLFLGCIGMVLGYMLFTFVMLDKPIFRYLILVVITAFLGIKEMKNIKLLIRTLRE